MKKGIFSFNELLVTTRRYLSFLLFIIINKFGDTTLFFGLSGTGKTTSEADNVTRLIGDDEHGWDENGIFNFEGDVCLKTNGLSLEKEPLK